MPFKPNENLIPPALSVLRIVSAYLLLQHGTAKYLGFPHMAAFDNLQPMSLPGIAGLLELVGGALLLIGLFTRPVAFILSGFARLRLLHRSCAARQRAVADAQRRRIGGAVLLRLPVHGGGRRRQLERRCAARAAPRPRPSWERRVEAFARRLRSAAMQPFKSVAYAAVAPGPRLIVLGAVHGNETCGTKGIARVIAEIDAGDLVPSAGRVTFVPVTNPLAYANQRRTGDRNLNRKLAPTDAPREFEDHVANWLCPLLARARDPARPALVHRARACPSSSWARATTPVRSSRSIVPRSRKRWRGGSASAGRSTAGSRPMPAASRGVRRTRRGFPTRRSISTRATASAPPNTCARSAAAR
jgi:uncharacterized membrane protein YphA (DoxX/SURF4 family)